MYEHASDYPEGSLGHRLYVLECDLRELAKDEPEATRLLAELDQFHAREHERLTRFLFGD